MSAAGAVGCVGGAIAPIPVVGTGRLAGSGQGAVDGGLDQSVEAEAGFERRLVGALEVAGACHDGLLERVGPGKPGRGHDGGGRTAIGIATSPGGRAQREDGSDSDGCGGDETADQRTPHGRYLSVGVTLL